MKLLRTLLLLLLCVMLPISGLAASGLTGECPMDQADPSVALDNNADTPTTMTGCSSMTPSPGGKTKASFCKITAQCQFGSLYHSGTDITVIHPAAPSTRVVFHYSQSLSIRTPDGLWRPPRSL